MKRQNQKLYLAQMVAAICVVLIHVGTVVDNPVAHFMIKSLICRIAVPFFFVNNAFFFRLNSRQNGRAKVWLKKTLCNYTKVFLLYLPFGLQFLHQNTNIDWQWTPLLIVASYFYSGSFYHLWYFPAMVFAIFWVSWLLKKLGYRWTIVLCGLLFIIGSVETYSSLINQQLFKTVFASYFRLLYTTRNGLFFSPIFVLIGFWLADHYQQLTAWRARFKLGLGIAGSLGIIEGVIVYQHQGLDKNFMYFTILFNLCYFGLLVTSRSRWHGLERLRDYSQGIFLLHMIPIQIFNQWYPAITPINGRWRTAIGIGVPVMVVYGYHLVRDYRQSSKSGVGQV